MTETRCLERWGALLCAVICDAPAIDISGVFNRPQDENGSQIDISVRLFDDATAETLVGLIEDCVLARRNRALR